jgi:hypothetical protein
MNKLDAFIKQAVSDVKTAKIQGKKGAAARKNLKKSAEELSRIKAKRKAMIIAIEEAKWKDVAYVLYTNDTICPCCNRTDSFPCTVHLEQRHEKTKAKRSKAIPNFLPPREFAIPRVSRSCETKFQVCADCFTRPGPEEMPRPYSDIYPNYRPATPKMDDLFKQAEARYYRKFITWMLPKHLLLTHDGDNHD